MAKSTFVSAAVAAAFFAALGPGCSSTPAQATDPHKVKRDTEIKHEPCDTDSSSAQKVDVKGTGHAAIVHVMKGGEEACRMVDLNMDGRPDVFIYYDEAGNERRREADYDRDGRPDEIVILKGGVVVEKDRSMTSNGRLDTWDTYDNGRLVKRERDTNGDGVIDQWWDFYDPSKPECAIVSNDANGDGEPDPQTAVDLCKEGKPVVASAAPPASGSAAASAPPAPPPPPPPPPPPAASPASSAAAPPAKTPAPPSATPAPPSTTPAKAAP